MLDRFHSKLHNKNHHTSFSPGYPDSASDPIAAPQDPFKGDFHVAGTVSATNINSLNGVYIGSGANTGFLNTQSLSSSRTYTFPDKTGNVVLDTTINPLVSALSAATNITYVQSNVLWVDAISGNDLTGTRERADKPFKTLNGALSYAVAGDTIRVHSGTYTDTGLGKNGVDWIFEADTFIVNIAPTVSVFQFNGLTYNVYGSANFVLSGNISPTAGTGLVADFNGSNGTTDVYFEFNTIVVNSNSVQDNTPTTSIFKGTFGNKNVHIKGTSIYAPLMCVFNGFNTLNAGLYKTLIDIREYIVGQTIFYGSFQSLTAYVKSQAVSASDYVYNDAGFTSAIDNVFLNIDGDVYGSILKSSTTGPLTIKARNFYVSARSNCYWNVGVVGDVTYDTYNTVTNLSGNFTGGVTRFKSRNITLNQPIYQLSPLYIDTDVISVNDATVSDTVNYFYIGSILSINTKVLNTTYVTPSYRLFYSNSYGSELNLNVNTLSANSANTYLLVMFDGTNTNTLRTNIGRAVHGGDLHLWGYNNKASINVGYTPETFIDINVGGSTESVMLIKGLYKNTRGANVSYSGDSGQTGSKLYFDAGVGLEGTNVYNLDLTNMQGAPLDIYIIGTAITNTTPIDPSANFTINCGIFESASGIQIPFI